MQVIRALVKQLNYPIEIVGIDTVRLFDVDPDATARLVRNLSGRGITFVACSSAAEACEGADIITTITASFAVKIVPRSTGSVWSCFQVLFLYSIWVIRLVASTTPSGRRNTAIDSHELFQ